MVADRTQNQILFTGIEGGVVRCRGTGRRSLAVASC